MIDLKMNINLEPFWSGFYPIRVIPENLCETGDVVREICESHAGFCPDHSNTAEHQSAHRALDETEYMLDPAPDF